MRALTALVAALACQGAPRVFDVRDYGAAGGKSADARSAIQRAIDECAAAGGGTVYFPPGEYASGQLRLRSNVRLYLEAGATLHASKNRAHYDAAPRSALLFGEDLERVAIEGRGTIEGQAEYEWRVMDFDDAYIRPNAEAMKAAGKPLLRPFPKGFPKETVYPRLVLMLRVKDLRITGVSLLHSPNWTVTLYACERVVIDGVYIYSSRKEAVWADGIDPDGCKDVRISNSTIETGDDALVFYSTDIWGPVRACENITVTNCRLSSASSALKFCDGNMKAVRKVAVSNSVITDSNRGIAFMVFDGGVVEDVVLSGITVECVRHDWFWWGGGDPIHFNVKRRSEVDGQARQNEPAAGVIRNVILRDIIARGQGTSFINGHPASPLDGVTLENVKLFVSRDRFAPYDKMKHAMDIQHARGLKVRGVEIRSEDGIAPLRLRDSSDVVLDGVSVDRVGGAMFERVRPLTVRNSPGLDR